jgi:hypothetical protein
MGQVDLLDEAVVVDVLSKLLQTVLLTSTTAVAVLLVKISTELFQPVMPNPTAES